MFFSASPLKSFLLSVATFAVVASAVPIVPSNDLSAGNVPAGNAVGNVETPAKVGVSGKQSRAEPNTEVVSVVDTLLTDLGLESVTSDVVPRDATTSEVTSIVDVIVNLNVDLNDLLKKIKVTLDVTGEVDLDAVAALLNTVQVVLGRAIADVKVLIVNTGNVVDAIQLANILVTLLAITTSILFYVTIAISTIVNRTVIQGLLSTIINLVGQLLVVLFGGVAGLKVALGPIIPAIIIVLKDIDATALVAVIV